MMRFFDRSQIRGQSTYFPTYLFTLNLPTEACYKRLNEICELKSHRVYDYDPQAMDDVTRISMGRFYLLGEVTIGLRPVENGTQTDIGMTVESVNWLPLILIFILPCLLWLAVGNVTFQLFDLGIFLLLASISAFVALKLIHLISFSQLKSILTATLIDTENFRLDRTYDPYLTVKRPIKELGNQLKALRHQEFKGQEINFHIVRDSRTTCRYTLHFRKVKEEADHTELMRELRTLIIGKLVTDRKTGNTIVYGKPANLYFTWQGLVLLAYTIILFGAYASYFGADFVTVGVIIAGSILGVTLIHRIWQARQVAQNTAFFKSFINQFFGESTD